MTMFTTASMRGYQNTKRTDRQSDPAVHRPSVYPKRTREITGAMCLGDGGTAT